MPRLCLVRAGRRMRLRSPSSTRNAKAKTSPGQDLVFIYIAKTLGLLVLLCFGTPSSSTKNVVQLPSPRPSSSTTTDVYNFSCENVYFYYDTSTTTSTTADMYDYEMRTTTSQDRKSVV